MTTTDTTILKIIAEALYRQAGYVPFLWHIDDVRKVNEESELSLTLTDAECLEVLTNARDNVSADTGMSLGIIEIELECLAENREGSADTLNAARHKLDRISAEMAAVLAEMNGGQP